MQLLWFLPSAVMGLGFALFTGHWYWGLASLGSLSLILLGQRFRERFSKLDWSGELEVSHLGVAISGVPLPARGLFYSRAWNAELLGRLAPRTGPSLDLHIISRALKSLRSIGHGGGDGMGGGSGDGARGGALLLGLIGEPDRTVPFWLDLANYGPHLLLIGPSGAGKSELLRLLTQGMAAGGHADIALLDFKGGAALQRFAEAANCVGFSSNLDAPTLLGLQGWLDAELSRREQAHQASHRPLLLVVDEFGSALGHSRALAGLLERVVLKGRSLGVQLIASNQSLIGVPRALLLNIRNRIAIGSLDPLEYAQLSNGPKQPPHETPPEGWQSLTLITDGSSSSGYFPLGFPLRFSSDQSSTPLKTSL